jgi:hypothetical protein
MLPKEPSKIVLPTCGVVIEKNDEKETVCSETAADVVFMVDPDDRATLTAMLLVCAHHSQELDEGKALVFVADNQEDRLLVQYEQPEKEIENVTEPTHES